MIRKAAAVVGEGVMVVGFTLAALMLVVAIAYPENAPSAGGTAAAIAFVVVCTALVGLPLKLLGRRR